jgi:phage gp29-like protein
MGKRIKKAKEWAANKLVPGEPMTGEIITDTKLTAMSDSFMENILENPDPILKNNRENKGFELYREMGYKDLKISSALKTRKAGILAKPWHIAPGSDDPKDVEWATVLEHDIIRRLPRFHSRRKECLSAVQYGFVPVEIIWGYDEKRHLWKPIDLKAREPVNFSFSMDDHELMFKPEGTMDFEKLPPYKFLVFTADSEFDNPYGTAIMRNLFWYYWMKKVGVKFWAMSIEKFGSPTAVLYHPSKVADKGKLSEFKEQVKSLRNWGTEVVLPKNYELKLLEAVKQSGGSQHNFANYIDGLIAQEVNGQTLTSDVGSIGSLAAGKVHNEVRGDVIQDDAEMLMDGMNTLIRWTTLFNYGEPDYYPTFEIDYQKEDDRKVEAEIISIAVNDIGMTVNEEEAYDKLKLKPPTDDPDENRIEAKQQPVPVQPGEDEPEAKPSDKKSDKGSVKKQPDKAKKTKGKKDGDQVDSDGLAETPPGGNYTFIGNQPPAGSEIIEIMEIASIQEPFRNKIKGLFDDLLPELIDIFKQVKTDKARAEILISDFLRDKFEDQLRGYVTVANRQVMKRVILDLAEQLKVTMTDDIFEYMTRQFLEDHFYAFGKVERITMMKDTLVKDILSKADLLFDEKVSMNSFVKTMQNHWKGTLAPRKISMITKTETRSAANWAVLQMGKQAPMKLEAWFMVDPASCDQCQTWAAGSPYSIKQAEDLGMLPHPNCNDQWVLIYVPDKVAL